MQARRVLGDVVGGGGKVVQPPIVHVAYIMSSMPFMVAPGPRSEGGAAAGHDVPVLILRVPYMEEKGADG